LSDIASSDLEAQPAIPLRILVVEDDVDQANLVQKCLERSPGSFEVETVSSGRNCVALLSKRSYEAVILDQSGEESILELLQEISQQTEHPPVVVVSKNGNEQAALQALKTGAYDYLVKDAGFLAVLPKVIQQSIEKHNLEAKLRDSEKRYKSMFEYASDAILVIESESLQIVEANDKAAEMFEIKKSDLLANAFLNLFPKREQRRVGYALVQTQNHSIFSTDEIAIVSNSNKDVLPVEISLKKVELEESVLLCTIRNIADKKRLQDLILNSKRRLQNTFDGIKDIICQVDHDYNIVLANKMFSQFAGVAPEDLVGRKYYELFCGQEEPCTDCPVVRTLKTQDTASAEKSRNGLVYELWSYPIWGNKGRLESVAIYAKNVTAKIKLEKTLIQSEKLATIGLLASGIAHELRNPLNVIETARYYIDEFLANKNQDIGAKLNIIRKNVQRSSKIINNLLEFSRHSEHAKERIDLNGLVESTVALIKKELEAKNICYQFEAAEQFAAYFSIDSLKQVLLNLIINAIQAMQTGGSLTIGIQRSLPEWVEISVTDTGEGISQDILPQIFSPFFTTKEVGEGTGLGLYITHMIVERDGGKIDVNSEQGAGTTFVISLPEKT